MSEENIRKEERDNLTIVLESLKSDFKMFGENLDLVRQKGDMTFDELGKVKAEVSEIKQDVSVLKEDVSILKQDVFEIKSEIKIINGRLDNIEDEVKSLRKDFDLMKEELNKNNMSFAEQFEERLLRVEKHLELS